MSFAKLLWVVVACGAMLYGCSRTLTPEEKMQLASLKQELASMNSELETTQAESDLLGSGLLKALMSVRLETMKTNSLLIQQRIHTLEGGAKTDVVVRVSSTDPVRAEALSKEITEQRQKLAEAQTEAARYTGGLLQAMSKMTAATVGNTVAMLDQQRLMAKYGMVLPNLSAGASASHTTDARIAPAATASKASSSAAPAPPVKCLTLGDYGSSVLQSNSVFTEVAWKADVTNSCAEAFSVRVEFSLYDKDEFLLDTNTEEVRIEANATAKARGKMLVSPPEKARRIASQGVSARLAN